MPGQALNRLIADEALRPVPPPIGAATEDIVSRHGRSVAAVIFYGSALRDSAGAAGLADFYVLTESYRAFHDRWHWALGNLLLPPNVYHREVSVEGRPVRSKYAVLSLSALERRTSRRTFESLAWGRFAQPCKIVYARDDEIRDRLVEALAEAARTILGETLGLMPTRFDAREIWIRALQESYRTELRAERANRAAELYDHGGERYDRVAELAFAEPRFAGVHPVPGQAARFEHTGTGARRRRTEFRWMLRRCVGKILSVFRLLKAALTFDGGFDYILDKIESHSGVAVTLTPWQRRHPVLAAPVVAWRLRRRSAFR